MLEIMKINMFLKPQYWVHSQTKEVTVALHFQTEEYL